MVNTRITRTVASGRSFGSTLVLALGLVSVAMRALAVAGTAVDDALEVDGFTFDDD